MVTPKRAATPEAHASAGGWPPPWRFPLLLLGFVALFTGAGAGLARLGWRMPEVALAASAMHAPLMVCGFFGTVIALERAVAVGRGWAYPGPLLSGLGGVCAVLGPASIAAAFFLAGSLVLLAASIDVWRRQSALFTFTLALGAACWSVGNGLWLAGWTVPEVVPWWFAFLILTIAGERLELSRFMPPAPLARWLFALVLAGLVAGLLGLRWPWGVPVFAAAVLALAAWLMKHDIVRRTVRRSGLTRYIAVCLLAGYVWLAIAGVVMLRAGGLVPATASYDAALHAIALGFVFSMVFGHAPIIFPAVLRVAVPYHRAFYAPLALLHGSLALRLAGDAAGRIDWLRLGGLGNALALAAFVVFTAGAVVNGWRARPRAAG